MNDPGRHGSDRPLNVESFATAIAELRTRAQGASDEDEDNVIADGVERLPSLLPYHARPKVWRPSEDVHGRVREALAAADDDARAILDSATIEPGEPANVVREWSAPPRPREWLIPDFLPAGRLGLLAGSGGIGKSRLALQLAAAIASGIADWLPGGPRLTLSDPATAVYWTAEDEPAEVSRRLRQIGGVRDSATQALHGLVERVEDRLHVVDGAGRGPLWEPMGSGPLGRLSETGAWLRAYSERHGPRLLVLDSLAATYAGNENDRVAVRQFAADWDAWGRRRGCAVMLIGHPPKSMAPFSGSTDWQAAVRWLWTFGLEPDPHHTAKRASKQEPTAPCLKNDKGNYRAANARSYHWVARSDCAWRATTFAEAHGFENSASNIGGGMV